VAHGGHGWCPPQDAVLSPRSPYNREHDEGSGVLANGGGRAVAGTARGTDGDVDRGVMDVGGKATGTAEEAALKAKAEELEGEGEGEEEEERPGHGDLHGGARWGRERW